MKAIQLLISASLLALTASACDQNLGGRESHRSGHRPRVRDRCVDRIDDRRRLSDRSQRDRATRTTQPGVEVFGLESYSALNNFNLGHAVRDSAPADQQRHRRSDDLQRVHRARQRSATRRQRDGRAQRSDQERQDDRHDGQGSSRAVVRILRRRRFARLVGNDVRLGGDRRARECRTIRFRRSAARRTSGRRRSCCSTARSPSPTIRRRRRASRSKPHGWATRLDSASINTSGSFARIARDSAPDITRTPAQAAAVDWAKVIDDAENGIQANFMVNTGGSTGWSVGYQVTRYQDPTWSEMSMMYMGMADVSGAYANFIAADYSHKNGWFLVVTPDQRWPQGTTRAAQNTASVRRTSATVEAVHHEPSARERRRRRRLGHFVLRLHPLALHQGQQQHRTVPRVHEG